MKTFLLMLSFFTRLPVPHVQYTEERYVKGVCLMPFVGLIIGLFLYVLSWLRLIFAPAVVALILLFGYIYITGGLHLDGLADTCDGVFSGRDPKRALEIMKDSRIGTFGVLSILFFFAFYLILYQYTPYEALILFPIVGKSAPLISAYHAEYARSAGMGKALTEHTGKREYALAVLVPVIASLVVPLLITFCGGTVFIGANLSPAMTEVREEGAGLLSAVGLSLFGEGYDLAFTAAGVYLAASVAAMGSVIAITAWFKKKLGGITGDTLGMVCEISQMIFVSIVYILYTI